MATLTAQVLIGSSHAYEGGINPTHQLFLSENSRPAWLLVQHSADTNKDTQRIKWIPTLENMFEDGLLMIALYVLEAKEIQQAAKQLFNWNYNAYVEVYDINAAGREQLYMMCRQLKQQYKIIVSIFEGSSIGRQLDVLLEYSMEVEVCRVGYVRRFNIWNRTMESNDKIDTLKGFSIHDTNK
jgi:hypothetical protein